MSPSEGKACGLYKFRLKPAVKPVWITVAIVLKTHVEVPKGRSTLFCGPCNEDPCIWCTILGSSIFGLNPINPKP